MRFIYKKLEGFTLLEMLIAVGLFSVVIVLISTAFLKLSDVRRTSEGNQSVLSDMRFSFDSVGQQIIVGSGFPSCPNSGCSSLRFQTLTRQELGTRNVEYRLDSSGHLVKIEQKTYPPCNDIATLFTSMALTCEERLTADNVFISSLKFFVENKTSGMHPVVTMTVEGLLNKGSPKQEPFNYSTTFSPRNFQNVNVVVAPPAPIPGDTTKPRVCITGPVSGTNSRSGLPAGNACQFTGGTIPLVTTDTSITLTGTVSDNVEVDFIAFGINTNYIGSLQISRQSNTWTRTVALRGGGSMNDITATAVDSSSNTEIDHIRVISLTSPTLTDTSDFCTVDGRTRNRLTFSRIAHVDGVHTPSSTIIERCTGAGCTNFQEIARQPVPSSGVWDEYTDFDVVVGTTYRYRVRGEAIASPPVYGPYSNVVSITTRPGVKCGTPPPPPTSGSYTLALGDNDPLDLHVDGVSPFSNMRSKLIYVSRQSGFTENVQFDPDRVTITPAIPGLDKDDSFIFRPRVVDSTAAGVVFDVRVPGNTPPTYDCENKVRLRNSYKITIVARSETGLTRTVDVTADVCLVFGGIN